MQQTREQVRHHNRQKNIPHRRVAKTGLEEVKPGRNRLRVNGSSSWVHPAWSHLNLLPLARSMHGCLAAQTWLLRCRRRLPVVVGKA
jgi:hypothetical protein